MCSAETYTFMSALQVQTISFRSRLQEINELNTRAQYLAVSSILSILDRLAIYSSLSIFQCMKLFTNYTLSLT